MMKKGIQVILVSLICFAVLSIITPIGYAFDTLTFGEQGEQELTVYGWLRNNTGYFMDSQPYQENNDKLATFRTSARIYTDLKMSEQLKFFSALQFAYEPDYDVEEGSEKENEDCYYCEYDDMDDVLREGYVQWTPNNKNDIKIGRQIAIWGESLTTRVGDVIHPEDSQWTLAFANLEDTRIPQWMVRGIHDIDAVSSSFEWIVNPLLTGNEYRVNMTGDFTRFVPTTTPGQRFGIHPEDSFRPPNAVGNPILFPQAPGVTGPPFSRGWHQLPGFVPPPMGGTWVPEEIPHVTDEYPDKWDDTRFGFRTTTYAGGYQFGLIYWHTQEYGTLVKRGGLTGNMIPTGPGQFQPEREYTLVHPSYDIIGGYMNKQLPWPGVIRAEGIYSPNKPFNTFDISDTDALVERDYLKFMLAYDLNNFFYFDWHKTAPFNLTFEYIGEYVDDADDIQYAIYATELKSYRQSYNARLSTNWLYNRIDTEVIVSYQPWGKSGLFMPAVKYKPGWLNNAFSFELKYINVFGDNDYEGLGILRDKDMVVFTAQFNF